MKKSIDKIVVSFILIMAVLLMPIETALAFSAPTEEGDYNFSPSEGMNIQAPTAYETERVLYAKDFGVDKLSKLTSSFVTDSKIYIAASDKIIITDLNYNVIHIISEYETEDGAKETISMPAGMFVTDKEELYVTEPENGRILKFDKNFKREKVFGKPKKLDIGVAYFPTKIAVDRVGRMYVIAENVYEGILELNYDGEFSRYFGVNKVIFSVADLFWRSIATKAQREKMELWLPTEFTNMSISPEGFVYTTCQAEDVLSIQLLNAKGDNVLTSISDELYPAGDISYMEVATNGTSGSSSLIAIDCNEYGMYTVLDSKRNRVFTYNEKGQILFVFGGMGDVKGSFRAPVDVKFLGDKILVVDQLAESVVIMKPTEYAKLIIDATKFQYNDQMEDAVPLWKKVAEMNPNLNLAYIGLANAEFREGNFSEAQKLYKLGSDRLGYSKSFDKVRNDAIEQYFGVAAGVIVFFIVIKMGIKIYKRKKYGKQRERSVEL